MLGLTAFLLSCRPPQLNMPEDEVAETIRSFRKNHLSELQVLAQIRCGAWRRHACAHYRQPAAESCL
jgi:hypothetical protein